MGVAVGTHTNTHANMHGCYCSHKGGEYGWNTHIEAHWFFYQTEKRKAQMNNNETNRIVGSDTGKWKKKETQVKKNIKWNNENQQNIWRRKRLNQPQDGTTSPHLVKVMHIFSHSMFLKVYCCDTLLPLNTRIFKISSGKLYPYTEEKRVAEENKRTGNKKL